MDKTSWMDNPALKNMDPVKKSILMDVVKESEGKSLNQSLPIILKAQARLKAGGISFTPEETTLMMDLLTKDLSPADKMKVESMKNMMRK